MLIKINICRLLINPIGQETVASDSNQSGLFVLVMMGKVVFVAAMQRVFGAMRMGLFPTFMVMTVMVVGVLAMHVFVAVVTFTVMNIFRSGCVSRCWSRLVRHRIIPFYAKCKTL